VVEQRKDKGARGIEIFFEAALFNTVSRFRQLRTLIMPHAYKESQIRTLLHRIPPLLTELGCTVKVWSDHFSQLPFVPQLRRLQLSQGTFGEDGFSFSLVHLSHITSLQLNEFVYRASIQDTLASAFKGLLALRTLTLPCVPHIELLLQHAHCIPSLSLLQLQWRGPAKEEVLPSSLSCPSLLSLRQLLQQTPRLHIHFVRLCGRPPDAGKPSGFKGLFSSRPSPTVFTPAAVKELMRTNRVAFHLSAALEQQCADSDLTAPAVRSESLAAASAAPAALSAGPPVLGLYLQLAGGSRALNLPQSEVRCIHQRMFLRAHWALPSCVCGAQSISALFFDMGNATSSSESESACQPIALVHAGGSIGGGHGAAATSSSPLSRPSLLSLSALASVEVQLVMQCLDAGSKTRMARTCKRLRHDAAAEFAWKGTTLIITEGQLRNRKHPLSPFVFESLPSPPLLLRCDLWWHMHKHLAAASPLYGLHINDVHDVTDVPRLVLLLSAPWARELRWIRLPRVRNERKNKEARSANSLCLYHRMLFHRFGQSLTHLRTLIMPYEYPKKQIEGLLESMPPHLTELGCTVSTWLHFAPLPFVPHLRCLHLFHGHFNEGDIGIDPSSLGHLAVLQLLNLEYSADANQMEKAAAAVTLPAATGAAHIFDPEPVAPSPKMFPLSTVFAGLSSLRTQTLPCIPQIELLLAHVHLCPSLSLLQLQWTGLAKEGGVIPASLSHPTPASVLQLLQQSPSLRVHFVRARESPRVFHGRPPSSVAPSSLSSRLKELLVCLPSVSSDRSSAAVKELLASGRVAFLWADPLHFLPSAGLSEATGSQE
jgi:hypothetical protein